MYGSNGVNCQARLKQIRRTKKVVSEAMGSIPPSQIDVQSSPLPRSKWRKPNVSGRDSVIAEYQPPIDFAIKSIRNLVQTGEIPSVNGLLHWLLDNNSTSLSIKLGVNGAVLGNYPGPESEHNVMPLLPVC